MSEDETILLVEDNEDDVFLMHRALKAAGVKNPVQVVEDGKAALDYLAGIGRYGDRSAYPFPALLFLDLKLPFVRGLDVLKGVREDPARDKPIVVVLTSSEEPSDVKDAYRLGANSYLVKPPTIPELHKLAETFRLYWIELNKQ